MEDRERKKDDEGEPRDHRSAFYPSLQPVPPSLPHLPHPTYLTYLSYLTYPTYQHS